VVCVGSFNPVIFQPEWLVRHGLISAGESEAADVRVVSHEVTQFSTELFDVQVTGEQFVAATGRAPSHRMMQDLVIGIFTLLSHTPITRMGLNRDVHFRMPSEDAWHALGNRLLPPEPWQGILESPGMKGVLVEAVRPDERKGAVFIRVEPSVLVHPGVYVQQNDHFDFGNDVMDAEAALRTLTEEWSASLERAEAVFGGLLDGK